VIDRHYQYLMRFAVDPVDDPVIATSRGVVIGKIEL
jgi:hypothetical protein